MGLFLGKVEKYNSSKGYITVKLKENIEIGDSISLEHETGTYNVSELMIGNKNIKNTRIGETVIIGRMKGNIKLGDNIFKMSSKKQNAIARDSLKGENRKIPLNCKVVIKKNMPLQIVVTSSTNLDIYKKLNITCSTDIIPVEAKNRPLSKEDVIGQISKTNDTPFVFENIDVDLNENLFLPKNKFFKFS